MKSNIAVTILAHPREARKSPVRNRGLNQLSLTPILSVEPVPKRLAIASDRYYLTARQGNQSWHYPIQLRTSEIGSILPKVRRLNWSLEESGLPADIKAIHEAVEQAIDGGVA